MIEHTAARGAVAAWKRHREEIAERNEEAYKQARADQKSRAGEDATRRQADAARERDEMNKLNRRLDKGRGGR